MVVAGARAEAAMAVVKKEAKMLSKKFAHVPKMLPGHVAYNLAGWNVCLCQDRLHRGGRYGENKCTAG